MPYRLSQCRTNYDFTGASAGDFYIEQQLRNGRWKRLEGFWPPYKKEQAKGKVKELEASELPQIFEE